MLTPVSLERFVGPPLHREGGGARTEVAQAKRPLSMIALDAGFADQSHFTRVFKRAFGETPGQYARSLKGGK